MCVPSNAGMQLLVARWLSLFLIYVSTGLLSFLLNIFMEVAPHPNAHPSPFSQGNRILWILLGVRYLLAVHSYINIIPFHKATPSISTHPFSKQAKTNLGLNWRYPEQKVSKHTKSGLNANEVHVLAELKCDAIVNQNISIDTPGESIRRHIFVREDIVIFTKCSNCQDSKCSFSNKHTRITLLFSFSMNPRSVNYGSP